jgi:hypothetical protein
MKRNLQKSLFVLMLVCLSGSINAQVYHFQEGFVANAPPAGWITTNVAWSTTHNNGLYPGTYAAKLKPNESLLICKVVNTADILRYYCQVRDTTAASDFHLTIEKSTDKITWTEISKDPFNKADTNWQALTLEVKDSSPQLYISFHATAKGGTAALGLCYIDDVSITKLAVSPSDATLTDFTYNSTTVDGFTAATLQYAAEVPYHVEHIAMGGTPNNPSSTMTITDPTNLRGTEAERTGKIVVKAPDGTTKTYSVLFTVSKYIYYTGFPVTGNPLIPFPGWTTAYTLVASVLPMGDHGGFTGAYAFKFVRGQTDKVGFLNTAKYVKSDTLGFWLAVDQSDGFEKMLVEKRVLGGIKQTIANILSADMSSSWTEFKYAIKENDSTEIIFTPTITAESTTTRIFMDDLYMTGKPVTPGFGDIETKARISISPNPAKDYITISTQDHERHFVDIHDVTGKRIFSAEVIGSGITVDLRSYPRGIYFVTCRGTNVVNTVKFIRN